jgi:hypothetical protein
VTGWPWGSGAFSGFVCRQTDSCGRGGIAAAGGADWRDEEEGWGVERVNGQPQLRQRLSLA